MPSSSASTRTGHAQGAHNETGDGIPHIRPFNVSEEGTLDLTRVKYISPPDPDSPHWLERFDVIFNNTNSEDLTGKSALFDVDLRATASNHMTIMRVLDQTILDPYWLSTYLHFLWRGGVFLQLLRRYVGQATVSLTRLRALELDLPPSSEQKGITEVLVGVQKAREAEDQRRYALNELFKALSRELMTGQIRARNL